MQNASPDLGHWSAVVDVVSSVVDLEASARQHGALVRRRGVRSAEDLLRLVFLYGPGGLSLRTTASFATQAGLAEVCDVSLLDRLRNTGDWLADILDRLLAHKRGEENGQGGPSGRLRLALIDGCVVPSPSDTGDDWRLHARYEPARGGFTDLHVTEATTAEALHRLASGPDDVLVQDRGYARAADLAHANAQAGAFLTRIGWRSLTLSDAAGARFDLLAALPETGPAVTEYAVRIGTGQAAIPARLILARKPPEAVEGQHRRLRRKASKNGHTIDPRSLKAAGFLMLLTSLSDEDAGPQEIVELYRLRWQIELAFKRLKSLGGFAELRAEDPRLVRSWLLAHLIAAVLVEGSLSDDLALPP